MFFREEDISKNKTEHTVEAQFRKYSMHLAQSLKAHTAQYLPSQTQSATLQCGVP